MNPKYLTLLLGLMLIITGSVSAINTTPANQSSRGDILYVGGSGAGNYSTIQSAITASNDGDTVYVYNGVYNETLVVYKEITLKGENMTNTIIDGNKMETVLSINKGNVSVSDFTFQNCKAPGVKWRYNVISIKNADNIEIENNTIILGLMDYNTLTAGIFIEESSNNQIHGNIITNYELIGDSYGIVIYDNSTNNMVSNNAISNFIFGVNIFSSGLPPYTANQNTLYENTIYDNLNGIQIYGYNNKILNSSIVNNRFRGIYVYHSHGNYFSGNYVCENGIGDDIDAGIRIFYYSEDNVISNNIILNNNPIGITLSGSEENIIHSNHIEGNSIIGIYVKGGFRNEIFQNNLIDNPRNAYFIHYNPFLRSNNWDNNYWSDSLSGGIIPKIVVGEALYAPIISIPTFRFDWHPAKEQFMIY